jgi:hypothetical protein
METGLEWATLAVEKNWKKEPMGIFPFFILNPLSRDNLTIYIQLMKMLRN